MGSYVVEPYLAPGTSHYNDSGFQNARTVYSMYFENLTNTDIVVVDGVGNVTYLERPRFNGVSSVDKKFLIKTRRNYQDYGTLDKSFHYNHRIERMMKNDRSKEKDIIQRQQGERLQKPSCQGGLFNQINESIYTERTITEELLDIYPYVHVKELNITVMREANFVNFIQPGSIRERMLLEAKHLYSNLDVNYSGLMAFIVDNDAACKSKFVMVAEDVVEIPCIQDPARETGIYIINSSQNVPGTTQPVTKFIELSKAKEHGFYATKDEAIGAGDPSHVRAMRENDLAERRLLQANMQMAHDERMRELNELREEDRKQYEKSVREFEQANREYQSQAIRDKAESDRMLNKSKERIESFKVITALVGFVSFLFGFWLKLNN
jgi:hypothetical protein